MDLYTKMPISQRSQGPYHSFCKSYPSCPSKVHKVTIFKTKLHLPLYCQSYQLINIIIWCMNIFLTINGINFHVSCKCIQSQVLNVLYIIDNRYPRINVQYLWYITAFQSQIQPIIISLCLLLLSKSSSQFALDARGSKLVSHLGPCLLTLQSSCGIHKMHCPP